MKIVQILKIPKVNEPEDFFGISAFFRIFPDKSGFFISCPNF